MPTGFWDEKKGWLWHTFFHVVRPLTQICTLRLLKHFRSVSGEFDLTEMLLKYSRTTTHDKTQVLKRRKQSLNADGLFSTHHAAQILIPQISTPSELLKVLSVGKGLGVIMRSVTFSLY
jgi:hypothetical protein